MHAAAMSCSWALSKLALESRAAEASSIFWRLATWLLASDQVTVLQFSFELDILM
jgi:hypothetical protein